MNSLVLAYKSNKIVALLCIAVMFICLSACTVMANCVDSEKSGLKINKGEITGVKKPHTKRCEVNLQRSLGTSPEESGTNKRNENFALSLHCSIASIFS